MAPTVYRKDNIRIMILTNDHGPIHVHCFGPDAHAKYDIEHWCWIDNKGFSQKALKSLETFILARREKIIDKWSEIYGEKEDE